MPFYISDLRPLKMRIIEALDRGESISFQELRRRIRDCEFTELIDSAGKYPNPPVPDVDWQELTDAIQEVLLVNEGDEGEHFYVEQNGYCLLLAVLHEVERAAGGFHRPLPNR